ncbi:hypothetical protein Tco_0207491, partial [Tanacetum coccineum]
MPKGVLVLFGLIQVWKSRTCDPILKDSSGNVIDIHDFLCLYEWTGSKVHKEVHYDVRPTLQRFPFYYTPPAATNAAIPVPTLEDLAAATSSSKVLAKADEDDEDACYEIPNITPIHSTATIPTGGNQSGGFVPFAVEGPSNR